MFGFLNVNKPSGITSHKVIDILRKITGIKQIGHSGTLDPLASGVLPVAIGKASRLIDYLPQDKRYKVTMQFGFISDTYDIEGNLEKTDSEKISQKEVQKIISKFIGVQKQIPPAYSAVHYNGKRLYELARAGKIPDDIPCRKIVIYKNEIINFDFEKQILSLDIACSKGTYIRSIVHDIGTILKVGAVMTELIRTESSGMNIQNSLVLSDALQLSDIEKFIINPINILPLKKYEIDENTYKIVLNGNKFKNVQNISGEILLVKNNQVIALAEAVDAYIQPKKVLL